MADRVGLLQTSVKRPAERRQWWGRYRVPAQTRFPRRAQMKKSNLGEQMLSQIFFAITKNQAQELIRVFRINKNVILQPP